MWKDPIVEETRQLREQYASQHNHDIDAIFRDIQQRQAKSEDQIVSFPSREPNKVSRVKIAST
jgi:hypothetical protein